MNLKLSNIYNKVSLPRRLFICTLIKFYRIIVKLRKLKNKKKIMINLSLQYTGVKGNGIGFVSLGAFQAESKGGMEQQTVGSSCTLV